jgi:hypothetical protein
MASFRITVTERSIKARGVAQSSQSCDNCAQCVGPQTLTGKDPRGASHGRGGSRRQPLAPLSD